MFLLRDVNNCCNHVNIPVSIISLDHEKAFDRVNLELDYVTIIHYYYNNSFIQVNDHTIWHKLAQFLWVLVSDKVVVLVLYYVNFLLNL